MTFRLWRCFIWTSSLTVPIMLGSKVPPDDDVDATAGAPFSVAGAPFAKGDPSAPFAIVSNANKAGNNLLKP